MSDSDTNYPSITRSPRHLKSIIVPLVLSLIINYFIVYKLKHWKVNLAENTLSPKRAIKLIIVPKQNKDNVEKYVEANPDVPVK